MERALWVLPAFVLSVATLAQDGGESGWFVASRAAHEAVWQRVEWETNQLGRALPRTNAFVELATGLNYFDETAQQFQPSREEWEVCPNYP